MDDFKDNIELMTFATLGNIFNLLYNIPLVYRAYKTKSTNDISIYFLYLRISGSISWLVYSILKPDIYVGLSYIVTLISSLIILVIKKYYDVNLVTDNVVNHIETVV